MSMEKDLAKIELFFLIAKITARLLDELEAGKINPATIDVNTWVKKLSELPDLPEKTEQDEI